MPADAARAGSTKPPGGPRKLASVVGKVLEPVAAKRGFAAGDMIAAWPEIVGERYAATTQPEGIAWPRSKAAGDKPNEKPRGGTLTIRVAGGMAIYLQHETAQLLERINGFLGFAAISAIRLKQAPLPKPAPPPRVLRKPTGEESARIDRTVQGIEDDGLRQALQRLGEGIIASKSPKSEP